MSNTNKYKVIAPGLDNHAIGDVIELTTAQAMARVNKVELITFEAVAAKVEPQGDTEKAPEIKKKTKGFGKSRK